MKKSLSDRRSLRQTSKTTVLTAIILAATTAISAGEPAKEKPAQTLITPVAQKAIKSGLAFLSARQNDDGSFGAGAYRTNVAICGLSGMAMMASGSTPGRGPLGVQVGRAVDFVLANAQASGFICEPTPTTYGPMYCHGFATTFLAESYGMSPRPEVREKLSRAVKLIVNTQNKEGGWRYHVQRADADISVTVCQVMALRAARNAGIYVPNATIERSRDYIQRCRNADGGYVYMLSAGGESGFPRSAAAIVALYSAGTYDSPEIRKGLDYLAEFMPAEGVVRKETYYEYGHYYAVQAMWHAGGARWAKWYPAIRDELVGRQQTDGSWTSTFGPDYATAMSLIVLQMPENQLPIFQR